MLISRRDWLLTTGLGLPAITYAEIGCSLTNLFSATDTTPTINSQEAALTRLKEGNARIASGKTLYSHMGIQPWSLPSMN